MSQVQAQGERRQAQHGAAPGRGLHAAFLLLCLFGLGVSFELTRIHLWVHTDPNYRSFCAVSEAVNCDAVAESSYSVFMAVPVSVWGMVGYLLMGALALLALLRPRGERFPAGLHVLLAAFSAAVSLTLGTISVLAISSVCILCLSSYSINIGLLVIALVAARRRGGISAAVVGDVTALRRRWPRVLAVAVPLAALSAGLVALYPAYWRHDAVRGVAGLPAGVGEHGQPWIGATQPRAIIEEYSDYQCPHCRRGHREMRRLVERYPDRLRFIHRHYPLDHHCNPNIKRPFHPRACELARMVACATRQGKAWEANDLLFFEVRDTATLAAESVPQRLGIDAAAFAACMLDPASLQGISDEIARGMELGVRGTPSYVLDGKIYPGHVPDDELRQALGLGPDDPL